MTVQRPAAGATDAAIDRLLDQRMVDLVAQVSAVFDLGHQTNPHQPIQDGGELVQRLPAQADQIGELGPVADHGHQLERRSGRGVELAEAGFDPLGQILGQEPAGSGAPGPRSRRRGPGAGPRRTAGCPSPVASATSTKASGTVPPITDSASSRMSPAGERGDGEAAQQTLLFESRAAHRWRCGPRPTRPGGRRAATGCGSRRGSG